MAQQSRKRVKQSGSAPSPLGSAEFYDNVVHPQSYAPPSPKWNLFDFLVIEPIASGLPKGGHVVHPQLGERLCDGNAHSDTIVQRLLFYMAVNGDIYSMWNSSKRMRRTIRKTFANNSQENALVMHNYRQWVAMSAKHYTIASSTGTSEARGEDWRPCLDPTTYVLVVDIAQYRKLRRPRWTFYLYGYRGGSGHERVPPIPYYVEKNHTLMLSWQGPAPVGTIDRRKLKPPFRITPVVGFQVAYVKACVRYALYHNAREALLALGPWNDDVNAYTPQWIGSKDPSKWPDNAFDMVGSNASSWSDVEIFEDPQQRVTHGAEVQGSDTCVPEYLRYFTWDLCTRNIPRDDILQVLREECEESSGYLRRHLPGVRFYMLTNTPDEGDSLDGTSVSHDIIMKHTRDCRSVVVMRLIRWKKGRPWATQ